CAWVPLGGSDSATANRGSRSSKFLTPSDEPPSEEGRAVSIKILQDALAVRSRWSLRDTARVGYRTSSYGSGPGRRLHGDLVRNRSRIAGSGIDSCRIMQGVDVLAGA